MECRVPDTAFQQDALFCKTPFINPLLSSSCGKQKTQTEEMDEPAGRAEDEVRVAQNTQVYFPGAFISTFLHRHASLPCQ